MGVTLDPCPPCHPCPYSGRACAHVFTRAGRGHVGFVNGGEGRALGLSLPSQFRLWVVAWDCLPLSVLLWPQPCKSRCPFWQPGRCRMLGTMPRCSCPPTVGHGNKGVSVLGWGLLVLAIIDQSCRGELPCPCVTDKPASSRPPCCAVAHRDCRPRGPCLAVGTCQPCPAWSAAPPLSGGAPLPASPPLIVLAGVA